MLLVDGDDYVYVDDEYDVNRLWKWIIAEALFFDVSIVGLASLSVVLLLSRGSSEDDEDNIISSLLCKLAFLRHFNINSLLFLLSYCCPMETVMTMKTPLFCFVSCLF